MQARSSSSHWPLTLLMGAVSLLNLFLPLVLVRVLSPEEIGQYKLFFLFATTAPWILLSSGFSNGIYYWVGKKPEAHKAFSATWGFELAWSFATLILMGGALYIAPSLLNVFFEDKNLLYILIFSVAVFMPSAIYEDLEIVHGNTQRAAVYGAFFELLKNFSMAASGIYFRSIYSVVISFFIVFALKFLISALLITKKRGIRPQLLNNPLTKSVFQYAWPASGAAALAVILSYCDQFLLGHYLSASEFAAYSLGCLSVPLLTIFEQSVNKVTLPELSAQIHQDSSMALSTYRRSIIELALWLIPSVFGLYFFAGPITRLLFTSRYPDAEHYLKIYSFFYLVFIIPYDTWARASGRSKWVLKTTALFALVSLTSTWLGLQFFGATGALVGFLLSQYLLRAYSALAVKKYLQWPIQKFIPFRYLGQLLVLSFGLGILTSSGLRYFESEVLGLIILGTVFWLLYVVFCVPLILRQQRKENTSRNILILTQYLNIGGLEKMILNLSQQLQKNSTWSPIVFVYDEITGVATLDSAFSNIPIVRFHKKPGVSLRLAFKIASYCRKHNIDQIHAHDLGALIYAVLAKIISFGRLRIIYTQHSFVHLQKSNLYVWYERIFTFFPDSIVVVSAHLKEKYLQLGLKDRRIKIIENGIPVAQLKLTSSEKSAAKTRLLPDSGHESLLWIISVARLHPGKGQEDLLHIWQQLPQDLQKKCLLVFVGSETFSGYKKELEKIINDLHLTHVVLPGSSLQPELWLQASDVFISASHEEGLPLAPLEAAAQGLPLILSNIPGHQFFSEVGSFFDLGDLRASSKMITTFLTETQNAPKPDSSPFQANSTGSFHRPDLKNLARQKLLSRFSVENMTEQYTKIYEDL